MKDFKMKRKSITQKNNRKEIALADGIGQSFERGNGKTNKISSLKHNRSTNVYAVISKNFN